MTSGRLSGSLSGYLSGRLAGSPAGAQGDTPEDFFAEAKLVDWFRADVGYTEVGDEIDTWAGQKRADIVLATAANFCTRTSANANFGGQPTINSDEAGLKALRVTGLATPIWSMGEKPHILIVGRSSGYGASADCLMSFVGADGIIATRIDATNASTYRFRLTRNSVANDRTVTVTVTDAALIRAGLDEDDGASGFLLEHNATSSATAGTDLELESNVTGMSFGATTAFANHGGFEVAEIVLLNDRWTAGELTVYEAYTLDRYGVP